MSATKQLRVLGAMGRTVTNPMEPGYLILYVNNVCNLRCDMCLTWDRMQRRTEDLTLEEFVNLSHSFRNLVQLTITGGEPTLNCDTPRIIEAFYHNSRLAKCTLITNGTYPDRTLGMVEEIMARCRHLDLLVTVSIDGPKEIHEKIRGVPGCLDKTSRCLDLLAELRSRSDNLSLNITSVISRYNWDRIRELYEWVKGRFCVDGHNFLLARGTTKEAQAKDVPLAAYREMAEVLKREENRSEQYLSLPLKAMGNAMRSVVRRVAQNNEYVIPCVAGAKLVEIYSNGDVIPCELIEQKRNPHLGNVREYDYDIVRLLRDRKATQMRRFIRDTKCRCTFECAIYASLAFEPRQYPRIVRSLFDRPGPTDGRSQERDIADGRYPHVQPSG